MTKTKEKTVFILKDGMQFTIDGHAKPEIAIGIYLEQAIDEVVDGILVHCYYIKEYELNRIIRICQDNDFKAEIFSANDKNFFRISKTTPLGQDWYELIQYDETNELVYDLSEHADTYDMDRELKLLIDMGKFSIKELLKDAEWKREQLLSLARQCRARQ